MVNNIMQLALNSNKLCKKSQVIPASNAKKSSQNILLPWTLHKVILVSGYT
jgi:hypothetical protein